MYFTCSLSFSLLFFFLSLSLRHVLELDSRKNMSICNVHKRSAMTVAHTTYNFKIVTSWIISQMSRNVSLWLFVHGCSRKTTVNAINVRFSYLKPRQSRLKPRSNSVCEIYDDTFAIQDLLALERGATCGLLCFISNWALPRSGKEAVTYICPRVREQARLCTWRLYSLFAMWNCLVYAIAKCTRAIITLSTGDLYVNRA